MTKNSKNQKKQKRRKRTRSRIFGTEAKVRLSVFRSNKFIYAQLIDDEKGITLASVSDKELTASDLSGSGKSASSKSLKSKTKSIKSTVAEKLSKIERAKMVGELIAKKAIKRNIIKVVFDRGGYKYHGRVRTVAEGARKGGLKF
jgi:large subunit ribosomal protein L18